MATALLTNQTANGSGAAASWPGGVGTIHLAGDFAGREIITVRAKPTGSSEYKHVMTLNASDESEPHNFQLENSHDIQAELQGAGTGTSVSLEIA